MKSKIKHRNELKKKDKREILIKMQIKRDNVLN